VLDATFATAAERNVATEAAFEARAAFAGLFLDAPLATRLARIASRRSDASDADADVTRRQKAEPLGERGWASLDAAGDRSQTTILALERLSGNRRWRESERPVEAPSGPLTGERRS
jgi:predicted kinase